MEIVEENAYVGQKIGIIYWDVNRLKFVNDTYGHQAGDQLIIQVAHSIHDAVGINGMRLSDRYRKKVIIRFLPLSDMRWVKERI